MSSSRDQIQLAVEVNNNTVQSVPDEAPQTVDIMQLQAENVVLATQLNLVAAELHRVSETASYNSVFHYSSIQDNEELVKHYTGLSTESFAICCCMLFHHNRLHIILDGKWTACLLKISYY